MDTELERIYATALECAQLASEMCQKMRLEEVKIERKIDKTWVTQADTHIESILREIISSRHPSHHILGEEQGGEPLGEGFTWILDPIDGTFSYVHGVPFYSSLLAVCLDREPLIGCASLPAMGVMMTAQKGKGAFLNGRRYARPAQLGRPEIEIVATADPYRFVMENQQPCLNAFYGGGDFKCRTYPDALGYYLLLNGSVRAFVDPKVEIWDVAPFHVILPEAGFAIHPWSGDRTLARGTSVAYGLDSRGQPLACDDVLAVLRTKGHSG